jgi:murein DD-endopeptidase MepM/ murein hydrolase activator NlpD
MIRGTILVLVVSLAGCGGTGPLGRLTSPSSPHEQYQETLSRGGLNQTALGSEWIRASQTALDHPVISSSPFQETGYFPATTPSAVAYRLELRRGRRLSVDLALESAEPARVFVDLFEVRDGEPPRLVTSLPADTMTLTHDVERDGAYLLRVQPELLRAVRFTLTERTLSSLVFPVAGLTTRAVQSTFGMERDSGNRQHEGVDIFAPRGTPVVAVTDGFAHADTNTLGGQVVWLRAGLAGRKFYYAHLDSWAIDGLTFVRAGDVLGYVGNTGNARTTSPHLHFGVYERGAVDPLPFVQPDDHAPRPPRAPGDRLGELMRVVPVRAAMRAGTAKGAGTRQQLAAGSVVRVLGICDSTYRVALPDSSQGYLDAASVRPADAPLARRVLSSGALLREAPSVAAPAAEIVDQPLPVEVLGRFERFELVRTPDGRQRWIGGD